MSLSQNSLLRPWRALPRIMGFYAAVGAAATTVIVLENGFAHPNRTHQLVPYQDAVPSPHQETPAAASPDLVAEFTGLSREALSSSASAFAAFPPETNDGSAQSAAAAEKTLELYRQAAKVGSSMTPWQSDAGMEVGNLMPDGSLAGGGVALASVNDRYARFPNGIEPERSYVSGFYVMPADLPRLVNALAAARAANASAGVLITSSDPSFMRDLKRRFDSK